MARQRRQTGTAGDPRGLIDPAALDSLIQCCQETEAYCLKCERAGLDVGPERKKNAEQLQTALRIKREWFPDRQ